jgi:deazaflavin-dependent oxidoreductase (nitroreductase family)
VDGVTPMKPLARLLGTLCAAAAVAVVVFTVGMRTKSPVVLDPIRRMNRAFINPRQHDAGRPGAYASLVRHTGRTTGTPYETPVVAEATGSGFVVALPYGSRADWVKNVLASGGATVVHEGETYRVVDPQVVPIATSEVFSRQDRRVHRLFGVDECLRVRALPH